MAKTGLAAKSPQIPALDAENGPRRKKRQIPGNDGQKRPTGREIARNPKRRKSDGQNRLRRKKPQIPAFGAENGPRRKKRQIPENDGQNSNPRPMALPAVRAQGAAAGSSGSARWHKTRTFRIRQFVARSARVK
jgi:hypothetical protein